MQVFLIPPVNSKDLEIVKRGNGAMVLTQFVIKYPDYAKFYRKLRMFKVLDNGACEGSLCTIDQVLDAAELVKADEVILPDILFNSEETIKSVEEALKVIRKRGLKKKYRYMAAVQGSTKREWWECFKYLNDHKDIDTIGISKLSCPKAFNCSVMDARLEITNVIEKIGVVDPKKEYHLLGGSSEILSEVMLHPQFIRSIDTSAPFEYGKVGKLLGKVKKDIGKAQLEVPIGKENRDVIKANLDSLLQRAA